MCEIPSLAVRTGQPSRTEFAWIRLRSARKCLGLPLLGLVACRRCGFAPSSAETELKRWLLAGEACLLRPGGYTCPKCKARVAELPSLCHVCGLSLVASPHLARSYHHLFPVPAFAEVPAAELLGVTVSVGDFL